MKINDYRDELRSPKWQKKRLKILKRDKWSCQSCGSKVDNLQIHHKCYFKETKVYDYKDKYLITLCEKCHKKEKENIYKACQTLAEEARIYFLSDEIYKLAKKLKKIKV